MKMALLCLMGSPLCVVAGVGNPPQEFDFDRWQRTQALQRIARTLEGMRWDGWYRGFQVNAPAQTREVAERTRVLGNTMNQVVGELRLQRDAIIVVGTGFLAGKSDVDRMANEVRKLKGVTESLARDQNLLLQSVGVGSDQKSRIQKAFANALSAAQELDARVSLALKGLDKRKERADNIMETMHNWNRERTKLNNRILLLENRLALIEERLGIKRP